MHVVLVGCGRVGSELTSMLVGMGHSVAIIDRESRAFRRLDDDVKCQKIVGFGFDLEELEQAGIKEADALVAVTSGDNTNILCARVARETYNVPIVVARIYDPRRATVYERLGIPTVATVSWSCDQIVRRLVGSSEHPDWIDASAAVCLIQRTLPDAFVGTKVSDLFTGTNFLLAALTRFGSASVASPDTVLQSGDVLHLMVPANDIAGVDEHLGIVVPAELGSES